MKVNSPIRPRVPVAAHWQQSGRGANNLPDDSLPIPQVPIPTPKRTTPAEEAAQKTPKHSSSSERSRKVTFRQPKTNCQPKTRKVPDNHCGLNIGTWNVRILRTAGNLDILLEEARRFNLDILGLCETHLTDKESFLNKEEFYLYNTDFIFP